MYWRTYLLQLRRMLGINDDDDNDDDYTSDACFEGVQLSE